MFNLNISESGVFEIQCSSGLMKKIIVNKTSNISGAVEVFEEFNINSSSHSFLVKQSGYFSFKIVYLDAQFVEREGVISPRLFICLNDKLLIRSKLILKNDAPKNHELEYFSSPYPGVDFLVDIFECGLESSISMDSVIPDLQWQSLSLKIGNNSVNIYSSKPIRSADDSDYVFSGYCWGSESFCFGMENGSDDELVARLRAPGYGSYTGFLVGEDRVDIVNDLFAFSRLFYFKREGRWIVSNRYHLLLKYVKSLCVDLSIDWGRVYSQFISNTTLFRQVYSHDLFIKDTYLLESYKKIRIDVAGVHFINTELFELLDADVPWDEAKYENLIERGSEEIRNNVELVFENKKFENVVVDLSGGRDSRVGLAAVTNLNADLASKVRVRSNIHEPKDLDVAIVVNNLFNYQYFNTPDDHKPISLAQGALNKRSYMLGYYFLWYCPDSIVSDDKYIRLSGESFEAFAVRYYSNTLKDPLAVGSVDDLINEYSRLLSRQTILDYGLFGHFFEERLKSTLCSLPGISAQEKFDSLFLLFRGSFHAGNLDRYHYAAASCMPLQSKYILLAKRMCLGNQKWNRVIYDVTTTLNPLLSILPYNNDKTNEEFLLHRDQMIIGKSPFKKAYIPIEKPLDISAWDDAYKQRSINKFESCTSTCLRDFYIGEIEIMLFAISQFNTAEDLVGNFIVPLYWYVTHFTKDLDELSIVHHKVATLYDLSEFCD